MLKTTGLIVPARLDHHEVTFDRPGVKAAIDDVGQDLLHPGLRRRRRRGDHRHGPDRSDGPDVQPDNMRHPRLLDAEAGDLVRPGLLPGCQGQSRLASKYVLGQDVGIFQFPTIDPAQGKPMLTAGDTLLVIKPPDGSRCPSLRSRPSSSSSPRRRVPSVGSKRAAPSRPTRILHSRGTRATSRRRRADLLGNDSPQGFDASDQMPPAVGGGAEWTRAVVSGSRATGRVKSSRPDAVEAIDAAWPTQ